MVFLTQGAIQLHLNLKPYDVVPYWKATMRWYFVFDFRATGSKLKANPLNAIDG